MDFVYSCWCLFCNVLVFLKAFTWICFLFTFEFCLDLLLYPMNAANDFLSFGLSDCYMFFSVAIRSFHRYKVVKEAENKQPDVKGLC